ncbi:MAG: SDR family NAD(P)-dependent oxidoreductase [Solirubrobacteraceae bacterium]
MSAGTAVIVGGTRGLGRRLAERLVSDRRSVVVTGRDAARARSVAAEIGDGCSGVAVDLCAPATIAAALTDVGKVDRLVITAIERDANSVREYDIERALKLATLKLVGYTEVLHALHSRLTADAAVLLFGGLAKDRPYPGSTTVTAVNGAVSTMVRTFATELAPVRVNAIHPGIVGDSEAWVNNAAMLENVRARTPTGRLITVDDVTDAALFLLSNPAVNGVNLAVDGGWMMM